MYLVAIGWMYVVVLMAVAEAMSPQGTVLGALITLGFYGLLPVAIVIYILGTPGRRRARLKAEAMADAAGPSAGPVSGPRASGPSPDGGSEPPGDALAPEREKV